MAIIIKSVEINATRDVIRKYYADPICTPKWSHILTVWEPDETWPSAGATAKIGVKSGGIEGVGVATTLAYEDETMAHHWHVEPTGAGIPFECWFTFDEQDGKTTVTQRTEYTLPGSYLGQAINKLFVERQNAKDMAQQLANLKSLAEADPD